MLKSYFERSSDEPLTLRFSLSKEIYKQVRNGHIDLKVSIDYQVRSFLVQLHSSQIKHLSEDSRSPPDQQSSLSLKPVSPPISIATDKTCRCHCLNPLALKI